MVELQPSKLFIGVRFPLSAPWFHGPVVMTLPCHGRERGSIPRGTAIIYRSEGDSFILVPWGVSSVGRASRLHREGQEFDPLTLHHMPT